MNVIKFYFNRRIYLLFLSAILFVWSGAILSAEAQSLDEELGPDLFEIEDVINDANNDLSDCFAILVERDAIRDQTGIATPIEPMATDHQKRCAQIYAGQYVRAFFLDAFSETRENNPELWIELLPRIRRLRTVVSKVESCWAEQCGRFFPHENLVSDNPDTVSECAKFSMQEEFYRNLSDKFREAGEDLLQRAEQAVLQSAEVSIAATNDSDGDNHADCNDACPNDLNKTEPGICGCGVSDLDSDLDGTPDCEDDCSQDFFKTSAGYCGCGTVDTDSDCDGTPDCADYCPEDPYKTQAGISGCGFSDQDTDSDGTPDPLDQCPRDVAKIVPGQCGCAYAEIDSDGDGTPDCKDGCPNDPSKLSPGSCDCGNSDIDSDGDGIFDCYDSYPYGSDPTSIPTAEDHNGDGILDCGI